MEMSDLIFTPLGCTLLLVLAVVYFLWHNTRIPDYWEEKGIPHVKPIPWFGSLLEIMKKPVHENELERYRKYGAVYGHYEGSVKLLSVADPNLLRNILAKDFQFFTDRRIRQAGRVGSVSFQALNLEDPITGRMLHLLRGEDWKRIRKIIAPTFPTGKIKRMFEIFRSCSKVLIQNFQDATGKGSPVNTKKLYGAFTMDVIASAAFSTKIDSHNNPNNKFVQTAGCFFQKGISWKFIIYSIFPLLMEFFKVRAFRPEGIKFFTEVTLQIMEERKRTGQTGNDFLQLLMDTAKEQNEELEISEKDDILRHYESETNDQVFKNYVVKKSLSFNELVAQCVIFFMAGYETTASTLAFATYHLALDPDLQEKLIKELDDTIRSCDRKLTYEAIQNMKYLDNVISETLRLNSPAIRLERVASEDYELKGTGIVVPKGTAITVPVYAIHRDAQYFPEPEKFNPDRFTPEEKAKRDPYTFMPFGAGPRNCVGMRFALVEVKVCLAYVLSHFRIRRCPETKVPLEYYTGYSLLQPKEIIVKFETRTDSPLID